MTDPSPISPMSRTPPAAISAKSASTSPMLKDRRARADLDAAGSEGRIGAGDRDGECLEPDDVLRTARHVRLAGRDHRRDPAVEGRLDEVDRPLAGREVADDRVGVRVDEAGDDGRPFGVDDDVGVVAITHAVADGIDPAVDDRDRVAIDERRVDVARDDPADAGDQRLHSGRLSAGRPRRRRPQRRDRRSAHAAGPRSSRPGPAAARRRRAHRGPRS